MSSKVLQRCVVVLLLCVVVLLAVYVWSPSISLAPTTPLKSEVHSTVPFDVKTSSHLQEQAKSRRLKHQDDANAKLDLHEPVLKSGPKWSHLPSLPLRQGLSQHVIRMSGRQGFVLALTYDDQLTAGSVNLLSLQCWAESLSDGVRVVEPFLHDSSHWGLDNELLLSSTGPPSSLKSTPRLFSIFDAPGWQRFSLARHLAGVVKWEEFLKGGARNLILVGLACRELDAPFRSAAATFAGRNSFRVVREICTSNSTAVSAEEFRSLIYGSWRPGSSVVLFQKWPGISRTIPPPPHIYRVPISDIRWCERDSDIKKFMDKIPQSNQIRANGRSYIEKYLMAENGYVSVMFRLEQMFIRHSLLTHASRIREGEKCIDSILKEVERHKKWLPGGGGGGGDGARKVFLAMDTGRYGSSKFRNEDSTDAAKLSRDLFSRLYGDSLVYAEWEESFAAVADFGDPGYVAMLQLNVAIGAKFVVLAGGGSFQSIAERWIRFHHPDKKVYSVKNC